MLDKNKQVWISKRFKLLVFERFKIKANELEGDLLRWCMEISDRWAKTRFDSNDKWHVSVIDKIINLRLDKYQPIKKEIIYGRKKQFIGASELKGTKGIAPGVLQNKNSVVSVGPTVNGQDFVNKTIRSGSSQSIKPAVL